LIIVYTDWESTIFQYLEEIFVMRERNPFPRYRIVGIFGNASPAYLF
jgi:hypothetical protein